MNVTWPTGTPDFVFGNPAGCWQSTSRAPSPRKAPRAFGFDEEAEKDAGWWENRLASTDRLLAGGAGTRLFLSPPLGLLGLLFLSPPLGLRTIAGPGGYTVTTETDSGETAVAMGGGVGGREAATTARLGAV